MKTVGQMGRLEAKAGTEANSPEAEFLLWEMSVFPLRTPGTLNGPSNPITEPALLSGKSPITDVNHILQTPVQQP